MMMSAENVMVTMFVNDSLKNMTDASMITHPWKIDFQSQMRKVLVLRDLPFYRVL